MKKIFLIVQLILMYSLHALFGVVVGLDKAGLDIEGVVNTIIVLSLLTVLVALINIITSVFCVFGDHPDPTGLTLRVKLIAIPWYIVNFVLWVLLTLGMLNPFFMIAIPIIIVLGVLFTYIIMISTGLYNIAYLVRGLVKKMFPPRPIYTVIIILHLIFCLDVVGAALMKKKLKKY